LKNILDFRLLVDKELVDANKRQYVEIQAQSATLEEQRIHINVLDTALKRLEEEVSEKTYVERYNSLVFFCIISAVRSSST
jgi:hypothetical protein